MYFEDSVFGKKYVYRPSYSCIKDLVIDKPIEIKDGFYVSVQFMYDDTKGYITKTYGPFFNDEKEYLINFLNMINDLCCESPDYCGTSFYERSELLRKWSYNMWYDFDEDWDCILDAKTQEIIKRIDFSWEYCPDDRGIEATVEYYEVKYYDLKTKQFFKVKLKEAS